MKCSLTILFEMQGCSTKEAVSIVGLTTGAKIALGLHTRDLRRTANILGMVLLSHILTKEPENDAQNLSFFRFL